MLAILNIIRIVTTLFFLVVLFYLYAFLPQVVEFPGWNNMQTFQIEKQTVFYVFVGAFALTAFFGFLLKKVGEVLSDKQQVFKSNIHLWSRLMIGCVNGFLIFIMVIIGLFNRENGATIGDYSAMAYIGSALLIGCLATLIYIFVKRNPVTI